MVKIEDLKRFIEDDKLDDLYREREEYLNSNEHLRKTREEKKKDISITQEELFDKLNNSDLKELLDKYLDQIENLQAWENEKFYKIGFCEGISLLLDCEKKNKEN